MHQGIIKVQRGRSVYVHGGFWFCIDTPVKRLVNCTACYKFYNLNLCTEKSKLANLLITNCGR